MSYNIVYNRQFLKANNKIIPLVLIGSNNLWECDNKKRARDWSPLMKSDSGIPLMTADELMAKAQSWTGGEYQEHFKWHSKWVDDKGLIFFVKNGIRGAATLEELKEQSSYPDDIYLRCSLSIWYTDGETYANGLLQQKNKSEMNRCVRNTDELLAFLADAETRITNKAPNEGNIYFDMAFPGETVVKYPKESKKARQPAQRLESDYWVVLLSNSQYILKLTAKHLHHTSFATNAKQFKSREAAEKWVKEHNIISRFKGITDCDYRHVA